MRIAAIKCARITFIRWKSLFLISHASDTSKQAEQSLPLCYAPWYDSQYLCELSDTPALQLEFNLSLTNWIYKLISDFLFDTLSFQRLAKSQTCPLSTLGIAWYLLYSAF